MRHYMCACQKCGEHNNLCFYEPYPQYGGQFIRYCKHCGAETAQTMVLTKKVATELRKQKAEQELKQSITDYCQKYGFTCWFLYESVIVTTPISSWQFAYHENKLDILFRCIQKKRKVQFSYKRPGVGHSGLYTVSPYALSLYEDDYYLTAAFDSGKSYSDKPFNFKVSRMEKVEETEEPARKIGEIKILSDGLGFADIQNYRRVMKNMWSGAKGQDVIVKVQPYLADSKLVLSADRVREDEDGSLMVFMKAILNTGFYQTLARYGDGVEIVRPEEARKEFVEYLKRTLDIYEEEK